MKRTLLVLFWGISIHLHAQINRQWVATFNGQGDYNDRFTCILSDAAGNYYLGGSTVNPNTDRDFLIQKINATGMVLWTVQLNGNGDAADEITALKFSPTGSLVATGISKGENTSEDFWTVCVRTSGDTLWTRRYDYAGEYDQPNALAIDPDGNILVTGQSDVDPNSGENDDYLTIKYNAEGDLLWTKHFNGLGNGIDRAVGIATNAEGKVFVTGRSDNGINDDYVTICYDASGNQQWIKYDDRGGRDRATALTMDPSGNILVTGLSSNGDNDDFWTLKYSPSGIAFWQKAYDFVDDDRAIAIATDAVGNVYVTGQSDQEFSILRNWDVATVAFSPNGSPLWAARYDGALSQDEFPTAIATDESGRVFVTGRGDSDPGLTIDNEIVTIAFQASNGNQLWASKYAGLVNRDNSSNALVSDGNGGCVTVGYAEDISAFRNALCLHYSVSGVQFWEHQFSGIGDNNDAVRHLVVDDFDNVYAAGFTVSNGDNRNLMMARFTVDGLFDCRYVENGSAASALDDAQGLQLGSDGNPIAMGYVKNSGTSNDIFLSKFNSTCDTLWARNINGNANGSERAYDMCRDGSGGLLLTGRSDQMPGPLANDVCYTVKINEETGNTEWIKRFEIDTTGAEQGIVIKAKAPNQIYVAGKAFNGLNFDVFLLKYDAVGTLLWWKSWHSLGNSNDVPVDMAIAENGDVYVLANTAPATNDSLHDIVLLKFNASGNLLWTSLYDHPSQGNDEGIGLVVDKTGHIVIAGKSDIAAGIPVVYGISVLRYQQDGNLVWSKTAPFTGMSDQVPDAIAAHPNGQIYLAGHRNEGTSALPDNNVVVFIMNAAGEFLWSDVYEGETVNGSDIPNTIYLNNNDFYVGGSTFKENQQRDMLIIKYSGAVSGTYNPINSVVQVFPNPARDVLNINGLDYSGETTIEISNPTGRVMLLQRLVMNTSCDLSAWDAGIYFFKIFSNQQILQTGKFVHLN